MLNILSYLLIIISVFIFTYIFNDKVNFTLLYMIILAPFLDYFTFILPTKKLQANMDIQQLTTEKGKYLEFKVNISNNSFIPSFFVEYEIDLDSKFIADNTIKEYVMVKGKSNLERVFKIKAIRRGKVKLELSTLKVNSLLGLYTKTIKLNNAEKIITIYPRNIELEGTKKIHDLSQCEDESSSLTNLVIGEPGYEYKEYVAGEPLNRINWKMSSKIDKLQIRKSINCIKKKKILILDPVINTEIDFDNVGDLFIESLMSLSKELYCLDYEVAIYLYDSLEYSQTKYDNPNSMEILREIFSIYAFSTSIENRFSNLNIVESEPCDIILFTSNNDYCLRNFINHIGNESHTAFVIRNTKQKIFENEVLLKPDYSLEVI